MNVLYTLIWADERIAVYNFSNDLLTNPIEKTIKKVCSNLIVKQYAKDLNIQQEIYECSRLSFHGTDYKCGQFILLPDSTNSSPSFAKICNLLCSDETCYLYYQKTTALYCKHTDLFFITEIDQFDVIQPIQLPSFHVIESYTVGEGDQISLSLRHYVMEHVNVSHLS